MNCIFVCVFNQEGYIDLFNLLLESLLIYGNLDTSTEILVYTSTPFMNMIKQSMFFNKSIIFELNDSYNNIDTACKARLDLFNLPAITRYEKVLYLDVDILVKNDIQKVFDVCLDDILYVLEEGKITEHDGNYGGQTLFAKELLLYKDKTAFTSGILLFNNCEKIKDLFDKINKDIIKRTYFFNCYDQPYIVYNAFKYNLYNNKILKALVVNNDYNIHSDKVIHHFPGGPGFYQNKLHYMTTFLNQLNKSCLVNGLKIYDAKTPPDRNTSLSLVGICVSYDYFDTLQFMLPVNHSHFEKLYVITQEDDINTINLCKTFDNVIVLLYDFKKENKLFDKYGALNYAQEIAYRDYPESWYLIIDSDIILPNNIIDILIKENLNSECIYGAIRNNVLKSSELLNKKELIRNQPEFIFNDITHDVAKSGSPSILGCFQLYKKKDIFHRTTLLNAGFGDYRFGHDNFTRFCNLENIHYFHLGEGGVNWNKKVVSFVDDANISINDIFYYCHQDTNNIYFDDKTKVVKYGNTMNIDDDIWTCSDLMRYNIYDFFKNKSGLKIAEIGAHKGYTTRILANIFDSVYAVDNSVVWMDFNKTFNRNARNIKYVILDIYNDSWKTLPEDIAVVFIDAMHTYDCCKSDIMNSIKHFKNLQYIIFDDYGVWEGVKKVVDEFIMNRTLIFEKFIGITDVPGPTGIVENVKEGIICSINTALKPQQPLIKRIQQMHFYARK